MSEPPPDVPRPPADGSERRPLRPGVAAVAAALDVRRHAVRGFALGAVVAAAVFAVFVLVPGTSRPAALYVGLGVVLGVSVGLLATVVLVGWRAVRLARQL